MTHTIHFHLLRSGGLVGAICLAGLAPNAWAQTVYATTGNHVYTVPANAIAVDVQVTGGEGGAGASGQNNQPTGGAGALGGYALARIGVAPGEQVIVLVGEGGEGGRTEAAGGMGGNGGRGVTDSTNGLASGGAGGTQNPVPPTVNRGGGGGTAGGGAGANGEISSLPDDGTVITPGGGGGGGVGGGGGGGGMGGNNGLGIVGSGGGGGGGSSWVKIGNARLRAGGGGGGGGAAGSGTQLNGFGGGTAGAGVSFLADCINSTSNAGAGGASSSTRGGAWANGTGGGGGGGGGGYSGGAGGASGASVAGLSAQGGQGGSNCAYGDATHPTTNVQTQMPSASVQGILPLGQPAGTGRNGRVVITPVFAQAATHPITEVASPPEGGSVACSPNPVPEGETSTCAATPNSGYRLTGVAGCGGTASTTSPFTTGPVTAACTVTATFVQDGTTPGGNGSVAPVPTLGEWSVMLLGLLAAGLGALRLRRRG
jgi:hypothetical protein